MSIRIAFTLIGGKKWTGGYNYLRNLLATVERHQPGHITPILMVGQDVEPAELAPFRQLENCEIVTDPVFDTERQKALQLHQLILGGHPAVLALLRTHRIDLVFESAFFFGWRTQLPAIAWIPDLQHRYLPHLFGRLSRLKRELGFRIQIGSGRAVMVSSEDTRQVCEHIYPGCSGAVHAVRFAVQAPRFIPDDEARAVADRYGLPEQYLLMPNQFWAHKNHRLVVHALAKLRDQGREIVVCATGSQLDPRNPAFGPALLEEVRDLRLTDLFRTPGLIPYPDLAPLMQASMALLNPSLFEGWSTTVEEARTAGVPMVLSDLAVHREQAGEQATYFDRTSVDSLAETLAAVRPLPADERRTRRAHARIDSERRVERFAADFVRLVEATRTSYGRENQGKRP